MKIAVYDLEMICWEDHKGVGEIIEIGAVLVDLEKGVITNKVNVIVKPNEAINPFTTKITGITQRMVDKQGVDLTEAIRRINKKISLKNNHWFAWGSDVSTIVREFTRHDIEFNVANFHNLAVFTRLLHKTSYSMGLKEACEFYGSEIITPAHRALPDAITTANLAIELFKTHDPKLLVRDNLNEKD
ncbi:exonuclease domain-containing protein [Vibrio coralliirubri]|uniref:3'-5' exonuclease n=1 Tax=Vibrio coralliirubri TaxID=1516159 RepID=UPI00228357FB|nr:3'-5' exonuclease [Vibrio coralliirubri]MCY9861213.1 exonuclease domain-containing protein [Vibrio coralliirubri]